jgi:hypothetical protein
MAVADCRAKTSKSVTIELARVALSRSAKNSRAFERVFALGQPLMTPSGFDAA